MTKSVFRVVGLILLVYGGMALMLAGCQRQLIYYPSRETEADLLESSRETGLEPWRDAAGNIIGWRAPVEGDTGENRTAVVFHGNAGHSLHREYFVRGFQELSGNWEVYLFEYPGYGARPGTPSEKQIKEAAEEGLGALLESRTGPLFLVGESLGGGVAAHLASVYPDRVDGLLLITPFTTLADVAKAHYPMFPVGLLLRERYDNLEALANYRGPVAVLLAEHDEVVPASLGRELHESYDGPKRLWVQEERTHNSLHYGPGASWWLEATEFLTGN